jgi:hypothetical protein
MAKVTEIELGPDDPIFWGETQLFKPVSRPSTMPSEDEPDPKEIETPVEEE